MTEDSKAKISKGLGVLTGMMSSAMIHKLVKANPKSPLKTRIIITVGTWGISLAVSNAVTKAAEQEFASYIEILDAATNFVKSLKDGGEEVEDGRD